MFLEHAESRYNASLSMPVENAKRGWRTPPRRRCRNAWLGVGGNLEDLPRRGTLGKGNLEHLCRYTTVFIHWVWKHKELKCN